MPLGKQMEEGEQKPKDRKQSSSRRDTSRISLHPLTVEEAVAGLLRAKPPVKEAKKIKHSSRK